MKNIYYIALSLACLTIVGFSGCENFLSEPVYTQPTSQYLVSSPEGMASTTISKTRLIPYKAYPIYPNIDVSLQSRADRSALSSVS